MWQIRIIMMQFIQLMNNTSRLQLSAFKKILMTKISLCTPFVPKYRSF